MFLNDSVTLISTLIIIIIIIIIIALVYTCLVKCRGLLDAVGVFSPSKNQLQAVPMKIAVAGADSYIGSVVRPYVELLSSKSPEWLNFLRFLIIPFSKQQNSQFR